MGDYYGPGMGAMSHIAGLFGVLVWGALSLLSFLVAVGLVFLLVRFLLVATRAAQLYVAQNGPVAPKQSAARTAPSAPAPPAPPASAGATTPPAPPAAAAPVAPTAPVPPTTPTAPVPPTRPAAKRAPKAPPAAQ